MRATLTIDLTQIAENWRSLDALTNCETAAVVKADAYGLGLPEVAPMLLKAGAKTFFTALTEEAVVLRQTLGPDPEIYVFSGALPGDAPLLEAHNLVPCLNSPEQLQNLNGNNRIALQIDTGMNRLGFEPADIPPDMTPELIISHLACSDDTSSPHNQEQLNVFNEVTAHFACPTSIAATGGIHLGPDYFADLTRPGIGLYKNCVRLSLPVIQTRTVSPGEFVGYSATFWPDTPRKIATVSAGYADGIPRILTGASLFAGDQPCPIVGRISMDLTTVDISDLDHTPQTMEILNEHQTAEDLAQKAQTIPYEILTSLGSRYERKYIV